MRSSRWYLILTILLSILLTISLSIISCSKDEEETPTGGNGGPDPTGLFESVPAPAGASFTGEYDCRESGKKRDYELGGGDALDIATAYKSVLDNNGWNTFNLGGISLGAGFQATLGNRYLNFQNGGPPGGARFINICVWPSQPNNDNCDQDCTD